MQALPRFLSTDREGKDEREFLMEYFRDPVKVQYLTFLKGYQWPFDSGRIFGGSSLIDLLVYQETILKGRRVFLDFLHNPGEKTVDFEKLPEEAREYLRSAGACLGTPIERLLCMNEPAVSFYLEHGVDLRREPLEIAVCVQHKTAGFPRTAAGRPISRGFCGGRGVRKPRRNPSRRNGSERRSGGSGPGRGIYRFCKKEKAVGADGRVRILQKEGGKTDGAACPVRGRLQSGEHREKPACA